MRTDARGFTLLEVLVALLLLSLALVGLIRMTGLEARALAQREAMTYGQWVAANAIAELRLRHDGGAGARRDGRADLAGRHWRWTMQIRGTDEPELRRVDVEVYADDPSARGFDDGEPVATLSGFVR